MNSGSGSRNGYGSSDSDWQDLSKNFENQDDAKDSTGTSINASASSPTERASTSKGHLSLDEFEQIERLIQENTFADSETEEEDYSDDTKEKDALHQDTGYQSANGYNPAQSTSGAQSVLNYAGHGRFLSEEPDMLTAEQESQSDATIELDGSLGGNHIQEQRESLEDNNEKLAATFGTTENFEFFLKQQLKEVENDEDFTDEERNEIEDPTNKKSSGKARSMRKTRSPAANRVRNRQRSKASNYRTQSSAHESSDELSVRSDASRSELRRRLRTERKGRRKENEVVKQLQGDYDDLLTRYAEAENVIDQLRIGAKIDLFAQLPNQELFDDADNRSDRDEMPCGLDATTNRSKIASVASSSGHTLRDLDSLTESSLKLPSTASTKFRRISLEQQAKELKEQMESFRTLLKGNHVAADEKNQFLRNMEDSLHKLEKDFTSAKTNDALRNVPGVDFDPNHELEGEICRLGEMLGGLKKVASQKFSLRSPLLNQSSDATDQFGSSDSDVYAGFNNLLQRYNKPPMELSLDGMSSVCSGIQTDDEEQNIDMIDSIEGVISSVPERFLRPPSSVPPSPSPRPRKQRKDRSPDNKNETSFESTRRSKSRLPRPVRTLSPVKPVIVPKPQPPNQGMEVDSGFMGSESSRQSYPKFDPSKRIAENAGHSYPKFNSTRKILSTAHSQISPVHENETYQKRSPIQIKGRSTNLEEQFRSLSFPSSVTKKDERAKSDDGRVKEWEKIHPSKESHYHYTSRQPVRHGNTKAGIRPGTSSSTMFSLESDAKTRHKWTKEDRSRSVSSASRDSALGLLCGEIAKLRKEISKSESIKPKKKRSSNTQTSDQPISASCLSESNEQSADTKKQENSPNAASGSKIYHFGKTRNAKVGEDRPIPALTSDQPQSMEEKSRWVYVDPIHVPADQTATNQRVLPSVVPLMPLSTHYIPYSTYSPHARIYIPASSNVLHEVNRYGIIRRMPTTPVRYRKEKVMEYESDENDLPLTRSQLVPQQRSPSVSFSQRTYFDPSLSLSLKRAERAANGLRLKSRSMYRSLRDSFAIQSDLSSTI